MVKSYTLVCFNKAKRLIETYRSGLRFKNEKYEKILIFFNSEFFKMFEILKDF